MSSHVIKFRKAWECHDLENPDMPPRRLYLPLSANSSVPNQARLSRAFGCPPLAWGRETLTIRLEQVPGLQALRLNDRPIPLPKPMVATLEVPLNAPLARNRLILDVCFEPATSQESSSHAGWGKIALVITPID
ncbi:MAG: hypothetical protein ABS79_02880 [Planctomycetes bacterium SCN 63-9]|nr:MAG: hypothetical protein ABS79_02880 [Planctomycetes bacterium SCN 63-9]